MGDGHEDDFRINRMTCRILEAIVVAKSEEDEAPPLIDNIEANGVEFISFKCV